MNHEGHDVLDHHAMNVGVVSFDIVVLFVVDR